MPTLKTVATVMRARHCINDKKYFCIALIESLEPVIVVRKQTPVATTAASTAGRAELRDRYYPALTAGPDKLSSLFRITSNARCDLQRCRIF